MRAVRCKAAEGRSGTGSAGRKTAGRKTEETRTKANEKKNRIPAGRYPVLFSLKNTLKNGTGCKMLCVLCGNQREKSAIFICELARM